MTIDFDLNARYSTFHQGIRMWLLYQKNNQKTKALNRKRRRKGKGKKIKKGAEPKRRGKRGKKEYIKMAK